MAKQPPANVNDFRARYPTISQAFERLGQTCHDDGGPLDEKSRRLVKLAIAIGHRHEGAVHSAVRQALDSGVSEAELFHAAILAITTIGWPAAQACLTWIDDVVANRTGGGRAPVD